MQIYGNSQTRQEDDVKASYQARWASLTKAMSCMLMAGMLASCGGDASTSEPTMFSGTVAVGAALVGVSVEAACVGAVARSAPTDSNGQYSISTTLNLPCTLSATDPSTGYTFRSLVTSRGIANVTPLTDLVFQMANGDHAKQIEATTQAGSLLKNLGIAINDDPTTSKFFPDETGLDKAILDFMRISRASSSLTTNPYTGIQSLVENSSDESCKAASRLTAISRTLGGEISFEESEQEPCPRLKNLQQLISGMDEETAKFATDVFNSFLNNHFGLIAPEIRLIYGDSESIVDYVATVTPYVLAQTLKNLPKSTLKKLATDGRMANAYVNRLRKDLLSKPKLANAPKSILSAIANTIVDISLEYVAEEIADSTDSSSTTIKVASGITYGATAYTLQALLNYIIDCYGASPKLQNYCAAKTIVLTSVSWMAKDLKIFTEARKNYLDINDDTIRISVAEELLLQIDEYRNELKSAAKNWIDSNRSTNLSTQAESIKNAKIASVSSRISQAESSAICKRYFAFFIEQDSICEGTLSSPKRNLAADLQVNRINRIKSGFDAKKSSCDKFFVNQPYGMAESLCLNLFNENNVAQLQCFANKRLVKGLCVDPPALSQISPSIASLGQTAVFTITGSNFPDSIIASIADASCGSSYNVTTTSFQISCKLAGSTGAKTVTVKTNTDANNGIIIDNTKVVTATAALPGIAHPTNGSRYEKISCGTWTQCDAAARAKGGHLVTIRSADEVTWLLSTFPPSNDYGYWIGYRRSGGSWGWVSGEASSFTYWEIGEPNGLGSPHDYAHMYGRNVGGARAGRWNDTTNESLTSPKTTETIVEYR
jgi:hypothetical protein